MYIPTLTSAENNISQFISTLSINTPSLYIGNGGVVLYDAVVNKNTEAINLKVQKLITDINNVNDPNFSFCSGVGGSIYLLSYLSTKKIIDLPTSFFEDIDKIFTVSASNHLNHNNYDFLHGAGGMLLSMLQRPQENHEVLTQMINKLLAIRVEYNGLKIWRYYSAQEDLRDKFIISLGLSHGIPSMMVLLAKFIEKGFCVKECSEAIKECVELLYSVRNSNITAANFSFYPSRVVLNEKISHKARLGWCYGDLGIGSAFYTVGSILGNSEYKDHGIEIYRHYCVEENKNEFAVRDAQFCHGSAGIAHMYRRMYVNTNMPKFQLMSKFWIDETIRLANHENGICGYKTWYGPDIKWKNSTGLLEGVVGIGLVLSSFSQNSDIDWDECFLLS